MKLRRMKLEDLNQVSQLYQEANQFATLRSIRKWTSEGLKQFPKRNFVIEEDLKILGAISAVLKNKKWGEINDVAVLREYQSKQLGSRLMKKILREFKQEKIEKIEKITLWVHWKNSRAIPFYYRCGFKIKRASQTHNIPSVPDGEEIIHLERKL